MSEQMQTTDDMAKPRYALTRLGKELIMIGIVNGESSGRIGETQSAIEKYSHYRDCVRQKHGETIPRDVFVALDESIRQTFDESIYEGIL
ncbi:MAG: hypothetical protein ACOCUU_02330 [Nanoarchaeota archaeon]